MALGDLIDRMRLTLRDDIPALFTDTHLVECINEGVRIFSLRAPVEALVGLQSTALLTSAVGISEYALPGEFLRGISASYKGRRMTRLERRDLAALALAPHGEAAQRWGVWCDCLNIYPAPTAAPTADDITLDFVAEPIAMLAPEEESGLWSPMEDLALHWALGVALTRVSFEAAEREFARFEASLQDLWRIYGDTTGDTFVAGGAAG